MSVEQSPILDLLQLLCKIGLYALDPIEGEILYSITPAIIADWMPPTGGSAISSIMVDLETTVSNSDNVSLEVNPNATATVKMVNDIKTELADVKGFVGYTEDDIYGVEVDFVSRKFTKLAGSINKVLVLIMIMFRLLVEEEDVY